MLKIRIRTKLAAALAVPLVALVSISAFEAVQASEEADEVRAETELAVVAVGPSSLTTELQNERNYAALDLIGLADAATLEVASVDEARERVDATVDELRTYLDGRGEVTAAAFAPAFEALESDLEDTRALWDDFDGEKDLENQEVADELFDRFTVMTEAFFDATESVATAVDDNALRNGIEIVDNSNRRGELLANITRLVVLDTLTDGGEEIFRSETAARLARLDTTEDRIEQLAVGPYADVPGETLGRDFDVDAREQIVAYLAGDDVEITSLLAAVSAGGAAENTSAAEMASGILQQEAADLTAAAEDRREQFILLAAGIIILAIVSSWLASRSITRPLRKLRAEAAEMAGHRLPAALQQISETPMGEDVVVPGLEPIVVKTRDEVHEVVDVLNDVQDQTLALAADQAVLRRNIADSFVNLGRRNQNLLDRQLEFITELEQNETEPDELESLFRLDHLATRMRRNAESLLVLAGVESPRQWTAPVSVDDVVRAALGEVEDYQRVNVRHLDPVMVAGTAAAGVSHVLAELIENALNFSPPGAAVEVKGRANAEGYMVAIDDDGIGMSAEDLEQANRRLSGAESYTVAPSRYLGHYVAGNLATRFGISVRLQDSPAGGVTATVGIPTALIAAAGAQPVEPVEIEPAGAPAIEASQTEAAPSDPVVVPVDDAGDIDAPGSLAEALGTSELASIDSVEDLTRAMDREPPTPDASQASMPAADSPATDPPAPPIGLPRRVPGAQRPDLQPTVARRVQEAAAPQTPTSPESDGTDGASPVAGAFGFLAGYSAAANGPSTDDRTTDERTADEPATEDPAPTTQSDNLSVRQPGAHLDHSSPDDADDERDASIQEDR